MSAHVTKRKHRISRMKQQRTTTKKCQKLIHPVTCQYATTTDSNAVTNQTAESGGISLAFTRLDCCMLSPNTTFHGVQSTAHQPNPHVVTLFSLRDVVMLFCPSFTRSARFLQADQFITRLRRVEHTATCCRVIKNSMRMSTGNVFMNVMVSDAVFLWAAPPYRCSTKFCTCH